MTVEAARNRYSSMPPGVCIPWEEKVKEIREPMGSEEILKNEWLKMDALAYIYLWWWVQR